MKKLYALLVILIIIYVGINVAANGLNILSSDSNSTTTTNAEAENIKLADVDFAKMGNFTENKINDTAVDLVDNSTGTSIQVQEIDGSLKIEDTYNNLVSEGSYSSSQEVDQNGVPAYFLYQEGSDSYNTDIYFAKNNHNYKISGENITYENSEFFINSCKNIIDTISGSGGGNDDGKISRF